jgi:hypothetical protein
LAVKSNQAGTAGSRPCIAHLAQQVGTVVHASGGLHTQRMKFSSLRK